MSHAVRATLNDCSPTWLTQPPTTWPTSAGSMPDCARSARSARAPSRSAGWTVDRPPLRRPIGRADGFDDHDFAFTHGTSLGQELDRSVKRPTGAARRRSASSLTVAERRPQGVAGVGDAAAPERPGGLVEAPVPGGEAIVVFAGQEVELGFHVSILPRGCDSQTWTRPRIRPSDDRVVRPLWPSVLTFRPARR